MDRVGDWVCRVVHRGIWKRGVVHGLGAETGIRAVRGIPDCGGDISAVFCGKTGGVRGSRARAGVRQSRAASRQSTVTADSHPKRSADHQSRFCFIAQIQRQERIFCACADKPKVDEQGDLGDFGLYLIAIGRLASLACSISACSAASMITKRPETGLLPTLKL